MLSNKLVCSAKKMKYGIIGITTHGKHARATEHAKNMGNEIFKDKTWCLTINSKHYHSDS